MTFCDSNGHSWDNYSNICTVCGMTYDAWCISEFDKYRSGAPATESTPCECGAEKAGFDSHSHWCPKAAK